MDSQMKQFQLGDFQGTILQDGVGEMPATDIFDEAPDDELSAALADSDYNPDLLQLSNNALLIDTGQKRVLIDAGNGAGTGRGGDILLLLDKHKIDRAGIDIVALSHAHADHYGGMLDAEGNRNFPNAEYVMWQAEWEHYASDKQMALELERGQERYDFISHYFLKLEPHLRLLNEDDDIVTEGIRMLPCYGHTRYHVTLEITSQNDRLLYLADAFLHPLCLNYPHWTFGFEYDNDDAIASRRRLRDELANSDTQVLVYHFPFSGLGTIGYADGEYSWQAVEMPV